MRFVNLGLKLHKGALINPLIFHRGIKNTSIRLLTGENSIDNKAPILRDAKPVTQFIRRSNEFYDDEVDSDTKIIPTLPTFYSSNPPHEYRIARLEALYTKYKRIPTNKKNIAQMNRTNWLSFDQYTLIGGNTRLRPVQYQQLIRILNKLQSIDPELTNNEIREELKTYHAKKELQFQINKLKELDEFGRAIAIGRRKAARAKIYLVRGQGDILVNGRGLNDYFVKMKDRRSILYPLEVVKSEGKYNIFALTSGGGPTGQAEAIMHGIAKALLIFNPLLKPRLKKAGLITRDNRHVERKKPGRKKARKMPTWVKR